MTKITIYQASPSDDAWIEQLHAKVFGPGRFARAAFRVREAFSIDPNLSLIAKLGDKKIATISMSAISIAGVNGYLLGPLATDLEYRGLKAGRKLVQQVCDMAFKQTEAEFVMLVGDSSYYGALGFEPAKLNSIIFPAPLDQRRILVHSRGEKIIEKLHGSINLWINE